MSQLKFKMKILEISHTLNYTSLRVKRLKINVRLLKYLGTRDTPCELGILYQNSSFSLGDEILQEHVNSLILH